LEYNIKKERDKWQAVVNMVRSGEFIDCVRKQDSAQWSYLDSHLVSCVVQLALLISVFL
jgi:hypothetical protein